MKSLFLSLLLAATFGFTSKVFGQPDEVNFFNGSEECDSSKANIRVETFFISTKIKKEKKYFLPDSTIEVQIHKLEKGNWSANGLNELYFSNGNIKRKCTYHGIKMHDSLWTYYSNGQLKRADLFDEGRLIGGACYDNNGNTVSHTPYRVMPCFVVGDTETETANKIIQYVVSNTKYPKEAKQNGINGMVIVSFVVGKDGWVENPQISRSQGEILDREAIRVVNSLPLFIPATEDGELAKTQYSIPIRFTLRDSEKKKRRKKKR